MQRSEGFTVLEGLVAVAVLLLLAGLCLPPGLEAVARQRVEAATRRVLLGFDRGREAAERHGLACALALDGGGWRAPGGGGELPGCEAAAISLGEGVHESAALQLAHNLPEPVRFSANGLVLDGGTVLVSHPGTALVRCVVVSLPLGVTRVGLQNGGSCVPDPAL